MGLALTDDHLELAATVRRWAASHDLLKVARAALDRPAGAGELPSFWAELAELGLLGLAVSSDVGGQGGGLMAQAVVLEELGRWCVPGPVVATTVVAAAVDRWGADRELAGSLVDGSLSAGLALDADLVADGTDRARHVSGAASMVWGGAEAGRFLLPVRVGARRAWCVVDRADVVVDGRPSFDATRSLASIRLDRVGVAPDRWLSLDPASPGDDPVRVAELLAGAEALGVADWCVGAAAEHARTRVQFGRPIGQFQAVKHRCADMLVTLEAARAVTWDALRFWDEAEAAGGAIALGAALALAPEAAFATAKDCIQVLGGIGYTWEHDAHLFLKRATSTRHLLDPAAVARAAVAAAVAGGERRSVGFEVPAGADAVRRRTRSWLADLVQRDKHEWRAELADAGYLTPHWPRPWGLDASPVEQLVIDEELAAAHVRRPHLQVAGWVLPTVIGHGSPEQQERFVGPSLRGEITWCQMFSEPDAGSDLASLTTRATRVDGGWSITGQKVWTTMAAEADWAICLARTDPGRERHEGIGCFLVDMRTPGIDIRPLRELTGMAMFNEIFLTDVVVPDDCLVGGPTDGWACARTTLANERVSMASGSSFGPGVAALFDLANRRGRLADPLVVDRLGALVVEAHAVAVLGVRSTLRALSGGRPGPEASVRKLLGVEHEQAVQETALDLLGTDAAVADGDGAIWQGGFLGNRALSIAGGTSEIQRNVIAERLLDLPKDP